MTGKKTARICIIGTVGVPGKYGGFETLAENLVRYHQETGRQDRLTVFCSARDYPERIARYLGAKLFYLPFSANGVQSVPYDILSLIWAVRRGETHLLILGVSGCICLPLLRRLTRARVLCNIDGIEWKREKWQGAAKWFLQMSEKFAVRYSDVVITDNQAIADYVTQTYGRNCEVIAYGGDHALTAPPDPQASADLPESYALALCRIEPENNVAMILEAFAKLDTPLVFVGNWDKSDYGRALKARFKNHPTITINNPVYEPSALRAIRDRASIYVHGHSAGGTNPSLVEMMHFDIPVLAHGCSFNRHTTEKKARYFMSASELVETVSNMSPQVAMQIGADMGEIARRRYTWDQIGQAYFELLKN